MKIVDARIDDNYAHVYGGKVMTPAFDVDDLGAVYMSPWFREELKDIFREVINEKKENCNGDKHIERRERN